jgi:Transposase DDE domain/Transposase domain (DUF772)
MRKQKNLDNLSFEGMEPWQGYLSDAKIELLNKTWAGAFRKFILPNLPVDNLAKHYSKNMGRPTKDLITAMGVAILQQIFDLTDVQTREQLAFNQQWHYALETFDPKEQLFAEKTLWTVRHHLIQSNAGHDIFNTITDALADTFKVDTGKQRLDSVHVYSDMAKLGRVRIMARAITKFLKNFKRHFSDNYTSDISRQLKERYVKEKSSGYFGNPKPSESKQRLLEIATDMQYLIEKYSVNASVQNMSSYKLMQRVISEQCTIREGKAEPKPSKEISSDSIQNPSDIDAGYDGHKGQGYQVQLSETYSRNKEASEENATLPDLITYVTVEPANNHDSNALLPALDEMEERGIKPDEILVDAAYGGDDNVVEAEQKEVKVISPVVGMKSGKTFCGFEFDDNNKEVLHCANGKSPTSVKQNKKGTFTARWSKADCIECPFKDDCNTETGPRGRRLFYSEKEIRLWQRRQYENSSEFKDKYRYRAGIEATNARYVQMTGARRVRYRGLKNVEFAETMKALGINMFRVLKHLIKTGVSTDSLLNIAFKIKIIRLFFDFRDKYYKIYHKYLRKDLWRRFSTKSVFN